MMGASLSTAHGASLLKPSGSVVWVQCVMSCALPGAAHQRWRAQFKRTQPKSKINMNLSSTNSSAWKAESVLISVGFSLIFLLGIAGNSLVLAVLCRNGQMSTKTTNMFIFSLGVADLCFIVFCVPFQATIYTLDYWVFGPVLCRAVHFIIFLTMYASIFTLTAVSLDRCATLKTL